MSEHFYDLFNENGTLVFVGPNDKLNLEHKIGYIKTEKPIDSVDKYSSIGMLNDIVYKYKGEIVDIKPEYDPKNVFSLRKFVVDFFEGYFR